VSAVREEQWTGWKKSTYSGGSGGQCAEVGVRPDRSEVALRDTKHRELGHLAIPRHEWASLLGVVRA
jgi:hypothetical protein